MGIDDYIIGHVNTGVQISKILELCELFDTLRSNKCKGCWAVKLCQFCMAQLPLNKQNPAELDHICDGMRKEADIALKLYCLALEKNPKLLEDICTRWQMKLDNYSIID